MNHGLHLLWKKAVEGKTNALPITANDGIHLAEDVTLYNGIWNIPEHDP
jgi:hypothetical protein